MAAEAFTQYAGWLEWRNEEQWGRYWVVAEPELLSAFPDDSGDSEALGTWMVTAASKAMPASAPGLPPVALQALEGRPHGFIVSLELPGQEGRQMLYFGAASAEEAEAWLEAVMAAASTPKQLEAWIDDFSDVEDDGHARRSSIELTEGIDWSKLTVAARKSRMSTVDEGPAIGKALSVKAANLADDEDDMDAAKSSALAHRSSLEMNFSDLDWATLGQAPKAGDGAEEEADEAEEGEEEGEEEEEAEGDGEAEEEAEEDEAEEVAAEPSTERKASAHEEVFGECF